MSPAQRLTKHRHVFDALQHRIRAGHWKPGERLPSEAELVDMFGVSRITVGRALRDLQNAGLVVRRVGSGTYVQENSDGTGLSFGLLIPDLGETEIFELICQGMMASPLARQHALVWGSGTGDGASKEDRGWELCQQYIRRKVNGVFFAPLEFTAGKDEMNRRIAGSLDAAGIPIVLLDRPVLPYPDRGPHDLVGIDNRRAGYLMTEHLLRQGLRRISFVGLPQAAATVDARAAGYREALYQWDVAFDPALLRRFDPGNEMDVRVLMVERADGIVCANDQTAARLMHSLLQLGYAIPDDVRVVGIDDLEFGKLLPVPLTTLRQPTREIGAAALAAMLERIAHRESPTRDILLHGTLVVRQSCGASDGGGNATLM